MARLSSLNFLILEKESQKLMWKNGELIPNYDLGNICIAELLWPVKKNVLFIKLIYFWQYTILQYKNVSLHLNCILSDTIAKS